MGYRLFLDDFRRPVMCIKHMSERIGPEKAQIYELGWAIVKSYDEFVKFIEMRGLPDIVSFDHDLCMEHYTIIEGKEEDYTKYEKTGNSCAKWLVQYCLDNDAPLPQYLIHSMNRVGCEAIRLTLEDYHKLKLIDNYHPDSPI